MQKFRMFLATNRILGRDSDDAGPIEEITPANLRAMLNVENGATADQTNAEIRAAVEAASNSNVFTDADHAKLNSISITSSSVTDGTNTFSGQTIVAGDNISLSTSGNNVTINATGGEVLFVSLGKMSQTQQVPSGYIWVAYGTAQRADADAYLMATRQIMHTRQPQVCRKVVIIFKVLADLQMVRPRVLTHLRQQTILGLLDTVLVNVSLS